MGEGGQTVQTSSYKIDMYWGCSVQHGDIINKHCIVYLKVAKRVVDLKSFYHKKKHLIVW